MKTRHQHADVIHAWADGAEIEFRPKPTRSAYGSSGKVDTAEEQMVFAEATSVLPLIASDAYHRGYWKNRPDKNYSRIFNK